MKRVAVFVSGGGRSLQNLAEAARARTLPAQIAFALSNKADAKALERARTLELPSVVLDPERKLSPEEFSAAAFGAADASQCDLVVLAGFLRLLVIPDRWLGRVLNVHPSLLPAFGGKGFYGHRVHEAVLARGCTVSGCTVHYVTNEYDAGPILLQRACPVLVDDDADALAARVFAEETLALPEGVRMHVEDDPRALRARARCR